MGAVWAELRELCLRRLCFGMIIGAICAVYGVMCLASGFICAAWRGQGGESRERGHKASAQRAEKSSITMKPGAQVVLGCPLPVTVCGFVCERLDYTFGRYRFETSG